MMLKRLISTLVRDMEISPTLEIHQLTRDLEKEGKTIYKLGFGQSPFPVPEIVIDSLRQHASQRTYLPVKGLDELRETIANKYSKALGRPVRASQIIIGPGSKELIYIFQLAFGGMVILPTPSWVTYRPQSQLTGRKNIWIHTQFNDDYMVDPEMLRSFCVKNKGQAKSIILNYPNNPVGSMCPADRLNAIAEIARKYHLVVVSDEIYSELTYPEEKMVSIATYYPEGTIITSGISKWCGAGGWRLGILILPDGLEPIGKAMVSIASETFSSVSAPVQFAAVTAYKGDAEIDLYLEQARHILRKVGMYTYRELIQSGLEMPKPQGAFYLFPSWYKYQKQLQRIGIHTSKELCAALVNDAGVALLPGGAFRRPWEELTTRLAYVDFDGGAAMKAYPGCESLSDHDFVLQLAPKIHFAIQKIKMWLKELN